MSCLEYQQQSMENKRLHHLHACHVGKKISPSNLHCFTSHEFPFDIVEKSVNHHLECFVNESYFLIDLQVERGREALLWNEIIVVIPHSYKYFMFLDVFTCEVLIYVYIVVLRPIVLCLYCCFTNNFQEKSL